MNKLKYKVIQVGTGGWGSWWCQHFLPANIKDGLIEVVAAVNKTPEALENARKYLGLEAGQCYTDVRKAFEENSADFCTIVVPPAFHEEVVDLALEYGLHILSEKPIADTLEASIRIAEKVRLANKKMGVTMSHRFDQDKTTFRKELQSGRYGKPGYLVGRYACDLRKYGSWGEFRHKMDNPLLLEGAVHHLDLLVDMAGSGCDTIFANTWNPEWGEYKNNSHGLILMECENGVRVMYEGANTNAVGLSPWGHEYIRAECENATLVLSHREIEAFAYDPTQTWRKAKEGEGAGIELLQQDKWANAWLIEQFVRWLDGGERMQTNVEDNLQSVALVFAAIESSRTGMPVKVQELLEKTRKKVREEMKLDR